MEWVRRHRVLDVYGRDCSIWIRTHGASFSNDAHSQERHNLAVPGDLSRLLVQHRGFARGTLGVFVLL